MQNVYLSQKRFVLWNHFTFTPFLNGSGGSFSSITYTERYGSAMIAGALIYINAYIGWSAASGGSGGLNFDLSDAYTGKDPFFTAAPFNMSESVVYITDNVAANSRTNFTSGLSSVGNTLERSAAGTNFTWETVPVSAATSGSFNKRIWFTGYHQADRYFGQVEPT